MLTLVTSSRSVYSMAMLNRGQLSGWIDGLIAAAGSSPYDSSRVILDEETEYWLERGAHEIPGFATRIEHLASSNIYDSDSSETEHIDMVAGGTSEGRMKALKLVSKQAKFYIQKKEAFE